MVLIKPYSILARFGGFLIARWVEFGSLFRIFEVVTKRKIVISRVWSGITFWHPAPFIQYASCL